MKVGRKFPWKEKLNLGDGIAKVWIGQIVRDVSKTDDEVSGVFGFSS